MLSNSLATYFISEIEGWKESILFYEQEIERTHSLLKSIIQMNTIPGLAAKVDHYYRVFERHQSTMDEFDKKLNTIASELLAEGEPLGNGLIGEQEIVMQKDLRVEIQDLETAYLINKYEVDEFIAETIIIQSKHSS